MKRKLVQQGPSTLMVSLPRQRVKSKKLRKGDEIQVEEKEGNILLLANEREQKNERAYDLTRIPRLTERIINSAYRKGIDKIELTFPNSQVFEMIQRSLREVVGVEIVNQTEKNVTLKSVSTSDISEFDPLLRRMFLMLLDMSESAIDAVSKSEFDRLPEIRLLESTNNRFSALCRRLLNKYQYKDHATSTQLYILSRDLEKIADQYKFICDHCHKNRVTFTKEVHQLCKDTNAYLREYYELFYTKDLEKIQQFILHRDKLIKKSLALFENARVHKKNNTKIVHSVTTVIHLTFDLSSQILVLKL